MIEKQELSVGDWKVQPDGNRIIKNNVVATMQPLSMNILIHLARHAGEVVTTQELLDTFWERRVVGDDAVHRRIADLRRHLGDDARQPRYILTIPKRGYRLIADVAWLAPGEAELQPEQPWQQRYRWAVMAAILIGTVGVVAGINYMRTENELVDAAVATAEEHLANDRYQLAFTVLAPYQRLADQRVASLLAAITLPAALATDPPGVAVSYRFEGSQDGWTSLGKTPINDVVLPRGNYNLRFDDRVLMNATHPGATLNSTGEHNRIIQMPVSAVPEEMVFVPGGEYRLGAWGFDKAADLGEFLLDQTEVSNGQFFEFVEAGGYQDRNLWQPIIDNSGGELRWADIERLFVDQTGAPGPAGWSLGGYTPGEADLPVVGVSWYEAVAYLADRGKILPSAHHWLRATLGPMEWKYPFATFLVPASNVSGTALSAVRRRPNAENGGAFDLIGNASEWTVSGGPAGKAVIGASYRDPAWAYNFPRVVEPIERRDDIGFRGIRLTERSIAGPWQDFDYFQDFRSSLRQVSDEMFAGMLLGFRYEEGSVNADDATLLDEQLSEHWDRRLILLPTGHDDDPLPVYFYLPKRRTAPLQSVIYLPPADSWSPGFRSESVRIENYQLDFIPRAGRALVWPVYSGSHERYDNYHAVPGPERGTRALERNRRIRDEIGRVIDFLDSSPEFDGGAVGLVGLSHGAMLASYNLAAEKRIGAAVLYSVGLAMPNPVFANPQNDPNVYWARVTQPTLIINGRYDPLRPHEFVLEPLLNLLATPADAKRSILYESAHWPLPRFQMMRDSLEWFDRYLGPVDAPVIVH